MSDEEKTILEKLPRNSPGESTLTVSPPTEGVKVEVDTSPPSAQSDIGGEVHKPELQGLRERGPLFTRFGKPGPGRGHRNPPQPQAQPGAGDSPADTAKSLLDRLLGVLNGLSNAELKALVMQKAPGALLQLTQVLAGVSGQDGAGQGETIIVQSMIPRPPSTPLPEGPAEPGPSTPQPSISAPGPAYSAPAPSYAPSVPAPQPDPAPLPLAEPSGGVIGGLVSDDERPGGWLDVSDAGDDFLDAYRSRRYGGGGGRRPLR